MSFDHHTDLVQISFLRSDIRCCW